MAVTPNKFSTEHSLIAKRMVLLLAHMGTLLMCILLVEAVVADVVTIPLTGGAESGEYLMDISVGSPHQNFKVKVTTGTYALMLPTFSCSKCKNRYEYLESKTYQRVPCEGKCNCTKNSTECGYQESFGFGKSVVTITGNITRDLAILYNSTITGSAMNCTFIRSNQRPPTLAPDSLADGIFGLSRVPENVLADVELIEQVSSVAHSTNFSLCLGEFGGKLILGGLDEQYVGNVNKSLLWVPMNGDQNMFTLNLTNILVGKFPLNVRAMNATIDAGTQYLQLPALVFQSIRSTFHELFCSSSGEGFVGFCAYTEKESFFDNKCYIMDNSTILSLPSIELTFSTGALEIPPTNYFVDYEGKACLALEIGEGDDVVIGSRVIQEYYTVFAPNDNKVGFAKAVNCSGAEYRAEVVSGDKQHGTLGEKLAHPLVIRVVRVNDSVPVQGVNVTFSIVDTSTPAEAMWISHAIRTNQPARVEPSYFVTTANGTAEVYLWLARSTYETTVSADIPLCLDHVIFTAVGMPSNVWRVVSYLFLCGLAVLVVLLNLWHRKTVRKRKLFRSSSSSSQFDDQESYFIGSPPQSPSSQKPKPNFASMTQINDDIVSLGSDNDNNDDNDDNDDDNDNEAQRQQRRPWYDNVTNLTSVRWQLQRTARRFRRLFR